MTPPAHPAAPSAALHELRYPPTPFYVRIVLGLIVVALGYTAYYAHATLGTRGQAGLGAVAFFLLAAAFSANLRAVNWRTIGWGIVLQLLLAVVILQGKWGRTERTVTNEAGQPVIVTTEYSVYKGFEHVGDVVKKFISFSDAGAEFVFGNLARPGDAARVANYHGFEFLFPFAFKALPPILFVSAFFTVLYHYGILQWCVRLLAKVMVYLMGTSGAETLSVSANVFMGQTEAPLIVKPYVPRMTSSELFALMVSGMAHISGGMMAVYINYGANPVAVITTCIMACPCSLYLAKLILPETGRPETSGTARTETVKSPYVNAIDAAAAGTTDGLKLALNVAAMLIVFIAFIAMFDAVLAGIKPLLLWCGVSAEVLAAWPDNLSLRMVFGWLFAPAAVLMGVEPNDANTVGSLLGAKLAVNEHFAYLEMKKLIPMQAMSERSFRLAAFALTGFANFASIGIQIGGIGAIAPERRHDLARLGGRALFAGFLATLLNASIAGMLID